MFISKFYSVLAKKINKRYGNYAVSKISALILVLPFLLYYSAKYVSRFGFSNKGLYLEGSEAVLGKICPRPESSQEKYNIGDEVHFDLSIIVPVHNAERFLVDTIDSVIRQNTKHTYEVIFIDDGSTDGSRVILEKYSSKANISSIFQENSGVSSARNSGVLASKGRYIMFLDADDILLPGAVDILVGHAIDSGDDIVCGSYVSFIDNFRVAVADSSFRKIDVENVSDWEYFDGYPWGKVYSRRLWQNIKFPEGYKYEDTIINALVLRIANSISHTEHQVVAYRQHGNSATQVLNLSSDKGVFVLWCIEHIIEENRRLGLPVDKYFSNLLIRQLTIYMVSRNLNASQETMRLLFSACCDIALSFKLDSIDIVTRESLHFVAYSALKDRDFERWYFYSLISC